MDLDFDQWVNLAEGVLWMTIGVGFAVRISRHPERRRLMIGTSISFVLFGISDFIEVATRAWHSPWWLLVLKLACVLSLVLHLIAYLRLVGAARKRPIGADAAGAGTRVDREVDPPT